MGVCGGCGGGWGNKKIPLYSIEILPRQLLLLFSSPGSQNTIVGTLYREVNQRVKKVRTTSHRSTENSAYAKQFQSKIQTCSLNAQEPRVL